MANSFFKFKQFTVRHDKCAMKVGTDGVLLGSWCSTDNTMNILDIGTGSGLISLMLAQRSNAEIDAIDIDLGAFIQATENVAESPFGNRIHIYHSSLSDFAKNAKKRYDLIVSNPPYFTNSLKSPDAIRTQARHNDTLSPEDLIHDCKALLKENGVISLIFPYNQLERYSDAVTSNSLFFSRITEIYPTPDSLPKRILSEISTSPSGTIQKSNLTIEIARHQYTEEYIKLTKDYYLKM